MTRKIKIDSVVDGELQVGDYTLPGTDGASGQSFTTDGSGGVGWDNVDVTNLGDITNNTIVGNLTGSVANPGEVSVTTDLTSSAEADELATGEAIKTYVDDNTGGGGGAFESAYSDSIIKEAASTNQYDKDFAVGIATVSSAETSSDNCLIFDKDKGSALIGSGAILNNNVLCVGDFNEGNRNSILWGLQNSIVLSGAPYQRNPQYNEMPAFKQTTILYATSDNNTTPISWEKADLSSSQTLWLSYRISRFKIQAIGDGGSQRAVYEIDGVVAVYYGGSTSFIGTPTVTEIASYNNTDWTIEPVVTGNYTLGINVATPTGEITWTFFVEIYANTADLA